MKNKALLCLVLCVFLLNLAIKLPDISISMTTDETPWLMRAGNFYRAVILQDWQETNLDSNIGVFTMWLHSISYYVYIPDYPAITPEYHMRWDVFEDTFQQKGVDILDVMTLTRTMMVVVLSLLTAILFYLGARIFGILPSLTGILLFTFEPFINGLIRTAHLDAAMSLFLVTSLMALINFLVKDRKWYMLVLSALLGGLAILSKLFGILVIPSAGFIFLFWGVFCRMKNATKNQDAWGKLIGFGALWGGIAFVELVILWPAMWQPFLEPITSVFKSVAAVSSNTMVVVEKTLPFYSRYARSFLWRVSPVTLLGLLSGFIAAALPQRKAQGKENRFGVWSMLIVACGILGSLTYVTKSAEDYLFPFYILMDLLAGIGLVALIRYGYSYCRSSAQNLEKRAYLTVGVFVTVQIVLALLYRPYFLTYLNPLLGGAAKYNPQALIGMGEGLNEAALYLNQKENADALTASSWYAWGPFSFYFKGQSLMIPVWPTVTDFVVNNVCASDYLVTYENQWKRKFPAELFEVLSLYTPEHGIWIKGIHYADIYAVDENMCRMLQEALIEINSAEE